jgi:hypothetical protein
MQKIVFYILYVYLLVLSVRQASYGCNIVHNLPANSRRSLYPYLMHACVSFREYNVICGQ